MNTVSEGDTTTALAAPPASAWRVAAKPALISAAAALALTLAVSVIRSRRAKRRQLGDTSSGVLGTIAKSVLFAAVSTIPKELLLRKARAAFGPAPVRTAPAPQSAEQP